MFEILSLAEKGTGVLIIKKKISYLHSGVLAVLKVDRKNYNRLTYLS